MNHRILLVTDSMFPLGPANQLNLLARELVRRNFEIHIAILKDSPTSDFRLPERCHIHHLQITKRDWLDWQKLRRLADRIQPDICHDFAAHAITRAAVADRYPQVSTQSQSLSSPPVANWLRQQYLLQKTVAPTHFAATHSVLANQLIERGVSPKNVSIFAPAVDPEPICETNDRQFVLNQYGLASDSVLIGTYAPLVPATRIKDLIWAVDLINCIRDDIQLLVMGSGEQLNRLKRFLRCTAATSHVQFIGCPTRAPKILSGLDVYWNSHLQWPLPISMLSAMNLGVPAVSVLGPETESAIQHQATGFGVNVGARDEFARWTKYLIEQTESATKLARQGQEHIRQYFSADSFVESYIELYSRLRKH